MKLYNKIDMDEAKNVGMGFTGWLTIVFIVLKLTGYIDWSWWWVLAPIWLPIVLVLGLLVIVLFVGSVFAYIKDNF